MSRPHLEAPISQTYDGNGGPAAPWSSALDELRTAGTFWVSTLHATGRPHLVPVLAVVDDEVLYFAAGPDSQKARNLARDPHLGISAHGEDLDIVIEGQAHPVRDERTLAAVAAAYDRTYGWSVEIRDGYLHGDGAPTAGPPPYLVFRVVPDRAFGFPVTGDAPPTRWLFSVPATT